MLRMMEVPTRAREVMTMVVRTPLVSWDENPSSKVPEKAWMYVAIRT